MIKSMKPMDTGIFDYSKNIFDETKRTQRANHLAILLIFLLITTLIFSLQENRFSERYPFTELYYLPIVIAAIAFGLKSAIFYIFISSIVTAYVFLRLPEIAGSWRQLIYNTEYGWSFILRIFQYSFIGITAGLLSDNEKQRRFAYRDLADELKHLNVALQERVMELTTIYDAAFQLKKNMDAYDVALQALESTVYSVHGNYGELQFRNEITGQIDKIIYFGGKKSAPSRIRHIDSGRELVEMILLDALALMIPDIEQNNEFEFEFPDGNHPDIKSLLCGPLLVRGNIMGSLIIMNNKNSAPFNSQDYSLFMSLSHLVAITLDNNRMYEYMNNTYIDIIGTLATSIEAKDPLTMQHCREVMELANATASQLGLPQEEISAVSYVALIHDLGKIGVSSDILKQEHALSAEQWKQIMQHPQIGANIVGSLNFLERIAPIIKYHHERYDGTGYPEGKRGDQIPMGARIISVVDSFHTMVSIRPYKKPVPIEKAIDELKKESANQFDPEVVDAFLSVLPKFNQYSTHIESAKK